MREGAYDYIRKPFRPDEVTMVVRKARSGSGCGGEVETLRSSIGADAARDLVVAESKVMRDLLELASRVARHNTTVLVTGESGTGKEVLAKAIHRMSPRHEMSFTANQLRGDSGAAARVGMFGYTKDPLPAQRPIRAGLFETAHQGTLLLEEIGDLPLSLQAKLLRVLEEGRIRRVGGRDGKKVDVRVIAATAKPLDQAVERGEFRPDLYYRLDVVRLHIPPLRERREDIPALLTHFARQAAQRLGHPVSITPQAFALLTEHSCRATCANSGTRSSGQRS
jgi:two-component system response regulator AtoC